MDASQSTRDAFLVKYDSDGNEIWSKRFGNTENDGVNRLVVENQVIYIAGNFINTIVFPPLLPIMSAGSTDTYVVKLDLNGNGIWSRRNGGPSIYDTPYDIRVDKNNNCFVTGYFTGPATFGQFNLNSVGSYDIFIAKYDATTGQEKWVVKAGSSGNDIAFAMDIGPDGDLVIGGFFSNTISFGSTTLISSGGYDVVIAKCDTTNGNFVWAIKGGGSSDDICYDLEIDCNNNIYASNVMKGNFYFDTKNFIGLGNSDIAITKFNSDGNLQWLILAGGAGEDEGIGIGIDRENHLYVAGHYSSTASFGNLPQVTSSGAKDIFIAKLSPTNNCCKPFIVNLGNDSTLCLGDSIKLDAQNAGSDFIWSTLDTDQTIVVKSSGLYWVEVLNNGCIERDSINIVFAEPPVFNLGPDTTLCLGQSLTLYSPSGNSIKWFNGSSSSYIIITEPGLYWLTVSNDPCENVSDTISISFISNKDYIVHNLVTSNADGKNDLWIIDNLKENTIVEVFNRWGDQVYKNLNYNNDWNLQNLPTGIYYYYIYSEDNCVKSYSGWLDNKK